MPTGDRSTIRARRTSTSRPQRVGDDTDPRNARGTPSQLIPLAVLPMRHQPVRTYGTLVGAFEPPGRREDKLTAPRAGPLIRVDR